MQQKGLELLVHRRTELLACSWYLFYFLSLQPTRQPDSITAHIPISGRGELSRFLKHLKQQNLTLLRSAALETKLNDAR